MIPFIYQGVTCYYFWFDTINLRLSPVYIKESHVITSGSHVITSGLIQST